MSKLDRPSSSANTVSSTGPPPSPPPSSGNGSENHPRLASPSNSFFGNSPSSSHCLARSGGQTSRTNSRAVLRSSSCSSVRLKSTIAPFGDHPDYHLTYCNQALLSSRREQSSRLLRSADV